MVLKTIGKKKIKPGNPPPPHTLYPMGWFVRKTNDLLQFLKLNGETVVWFWFIFKERKLAMYFFFNSNNCTTLVQAFQVNNPQKTENSEWVGHDSIFKFPCNNTNKPTNPTTHTYRCSSYSMTMSEQLPCDRVTLLSLLKPPFLKGGGGGGGEQYVVFWAIFASW
jgi:hypothetical protein